MILVWHVISEDQAIKGSKNNYHPAKFSGHRHSVSGDIIFLVCYAILS